VRRRRGLVTRALVMLRGARILRKHLRTERRRQLTVASS
jgi:hypothetical protein